LTAERRGRGEREREAAAAGAQRRREDPISKIRRAFLLAGSVPLRIRPVSSLLTPSRER